MKKITVQTLFLSIFILSCSDSNDASKTTIEWLYSDEGKSVGAIYKTKWVSDQTLYLMDMRLPKEDRSILKLDPESPEKMNLWQDSGLRRDKVGVRHAEPLRSVELETDR